MLAYKDEYVIGRVDASLISSRGRCKLLQCLFRLDLCIGKVRGIMEIGQLLLKGLIEELNKHNVELLIAMTAGKKTMETQSFYHSVVNETVGIWIEIKK